MSFVIYYSNYCQNSKTIISKIVKELENPANIHWVCIDSRVTEKNSTYVVLPNGNKIIIPTAINRVPAMMSLKDYNISYGADIVSTLSSQIRSDYPPPPQVSMTQHIESTRGTASSNRMWGGGGGEGPIGGGGGGGEYPPPTRPTLSVGGGPNKGGQRSVGPPTNGGGGGVGSGVGSIGEPMSYSLGGGGLFGSNVSSDYYSAWEASPEQLLATGDGGTLQMHNYVPVTYMDTITSAPSESASRNGPRMGDSVTVENLQKQRSSEFNTMMSK